MTRTCVAHVVSLACALHIACAIFMRSCCVFDSLRLLHFPLLAVYLLTYRPVVPPGHQLHLPRCGGQIPCALQLMRTLALLPSTTLSHLPYISVGISSTPSRTECREQGDPLMLAPFARGQHPTPAGSAIRSMGFRDR